MVEGGAISLTDSQKKKLVNSFKNNKNIYLRLKANQVNSSKLTKNPFVDIKKTKTGYSLRINENDVSQVKQGGYVQALLSILGPLAYELLKEPVSDLGKYVYAKGKQYSKKLFSGSCVDRYTKCNKCHGKGMMQIE